MAGVYIHIPFCKKACHYCNFHFSTSLRYKEEMIAAMIREIHAQAPLMRDEILESIYFGGGTPSVLPVADLLSIFEALNAHWSFTSLKEVTMEANPDDITSHFLKEIKSTPVNRFSMGVQSFRDEDLRWMNRAHDSHQSDYAIKAAQDAGFDQITIDLIYATPGMSDAQWLQNLMQTQQYHLPHFSAYALTVEQGTALHHAILKQQTSAPQEERMVAQMRILQEFATSQGWEHYEISNLCRPNNRAVHNTNYWMGKPYLGIGPSAHSYYQGKRWWNVSHNMQYIKGIDKEQPERESEILRPEEVFNEYMLTQLRIKEGIPLSALIEKFGQEKGNKVWQDAQKFIEKNWLKVEEDCLRLTTEGYLFADGIAAEFFI